MINYTPIPGGMLFSAADLYYAGCGMQFSEEPELIDGRLLTRDGAWFVQPSALDAGKRRFALLIFEYDGAEKLFFIRRGEEKPQELPVGIYGGRRAVVARISGNSEPIGEEDTAVAENAPPFALTVRDGVFPFPDTLTGDEGAAIISSASSLPLTVYSAPRPTYGEGTAERFSILCLGFFDDAGTAEAYARSGALPPITAREIFFKEADRTLIDGFFAAAEERKAEIRRSRGISPDDITGSCYFLSNNGDDLADGRTPQTAWRTADRLTAARDQLRAGDGVFFERGSSWQCGVPTNYSGKYVFKLVSGVTYGAYGEGDKPLFTGGFDASGAGSWLPSGYDGVWRYREAVGSDLDDIGNIIFDPDPLGGKARAWGIKILSSDNYSPFGPGRKSEDCGMVTNGIDCYECLSRSLDNPSSLCGELEFLHDWSDGTLYLRCSRGNPGEVFGRIMVSRRGIVIRGDDRGSRDITIDGIAVKFTGAHGIQTTSARGVDIRNCEFGWIGGSVQSCEKSHGGRYGNAIENWGDCDGFFVHDNYFYQCYDTGVTSQFGGGECDCLMTNAFFENNILEYINTGFELWNNVKRGNAAITSSALRGNMQFYSGYGFGVQRPRYNKNGAFNLGLKQHDTVCRDYLVERNICVYASFFTNGEGRPAVDGGEGVTFRENTYVMSAERGCILRSRGDITSRAGGIKVCYPYNERTAVYLDSLGIERGTKYYFYRDFLFPAEADGVFY